MNRREMIGQLAEDRVRDFLTNMGYEVVYGVAPDLQKNSYDLRLFNKQGFVVNVSVKASSDDCISLRMARVGDDGTITSKHNDAYDIMHKQVDLVAFVSGEEIMFVSNNELSSYLKKWKFPSPIDPYEAAIDWCMHGQNRYLGHKIRGFYILPNEERHDSSIFMKININNLNKIPYENLEDYIESRIEL